MLLAGKSLEGKFGQKKTTLKMDVLGPWHVMAVQLNYVMKTNETTRRYVTQNYFL